MKKLMLLLGVLALTFSMAGCGGGDTKADETPAAGGGEEATEEGDGEEAEAPKKEMKKFEGNKMERAEEDE